MRVVYSGQPPKRPVKARILLNLAVGLILAVCCAAGAAFVQEQMDNTIKTSQDIEQFLRVPALALIPLQESLNHRTNGNHTSPGSGSWLLSRNRKLVAREKELENGGIPIDQAATQLSALSPPFHPMATSKLFSR